MSLPPQTPQDSYSRDEVQHIVAREVAKQQLQELKNGQIEIEKKIAEMTSNFWVEMRAIRKAFEDQPEMLKAAISAFRTQIDKDFPSRLEVLTLEKKIEDRIADLDHRLEKQWLKITIPIGALTAIGAVVNWMISVGTAFRT